MDSIPDPNSDHEQLNCQLMDGFAVVVQATLASIALCSLFVKRMREHPRRPLIVWAMDTSKQALAASFVHFANVFVSSVAGIDAEGKEGRSANPCVWYFLNLGLDTTIGVGVLYVFLRILHAIADALRITDMESGVYGNPPRFMPWLKQFTLFIIAWFFVKLLVVISLEVFPFFGQFGEWILSPLARTGDPRLQVLVVMLIFPLIMNIIQAWLIDMVIKGKIGKRASGAGAGAGLASGADVEEGARESDALRWDSDGELEISSTHDSRSSTIAAAASAFLGTTVRKRPAGAGFGSSGASRSAAGSFIDHLDADIEAEFGDENFGAGPSGLHSGAGGAAPGWMGWIAGLVPGSRASRGVAYSRIESPSPAVNSEAPLFVSPEISDQDSPTRPSRGALLLRRQSSRSSSSLSPIASPHATGSSAAAALAAAGGPGSGTAHTAGRLISTDSPRSSARGSLGSADILAQASAAPGSQLGASRADTSSQYFSAETGLNNP
ncbi:hypothetical protein HK105_208665 [Polyrhizophydium stewartii]|uniref:Vacuolar membrane protein n=1 Tax=Polyrhizophydium stewartii TaxID=2732419 RepID=A0ABR4MX93_9FUNG